MMTTPTSFEDINSSEGRTNLFPQYLMKLLNEEVAPQSLWWLPDGKAFAINPDKIAEEVLDKHFQKTKYSSFIRRLHNEGYRRQTRKYKKVDGLALPEGTVVLSHDSFQREKPELLDSFYKKTNESPKASALQQAKAEHKVLSVTESLLDTPSPLDQLKHPQTHSHNAIAGAFSALPRLTDMPQGLSTSALYSSLNATAPAPLGVFPNSASLSKSIAALRASRLEDAKLPPAFGSLTRNSSNESAPLAGLPQTSKSAAAALLLDSELRLQQLRYEQTRREQVNRLSAMEALRLRAAAYSAQWP